MKLISRRNIIKLVAAVCVLAMMIGFSAVALADVNWKPDQKTITIRVANAAGGQADLIQRLNAQELQNVLGVTTLVQNITGASGALMAADLDEYDPSACEIMLGTEALFVIAPFFQDDLEISLDDYMIYYGSDGTSAPTTLCVPAELGVNTWEEFVEYAKSNRILCASNTPGGLTHLQATALFGSAGIEFTSVTDSGGNKNVLSCLNGDANCVVVNTSVAADYVTSGKLVPLVQFNPVTYDHDYCEAWEGPAIPSVAEIGYPEIAMESCSILCCRAGADEKGVEAITQILYDYVHSERGKADYAEIGSEIRWIPAEEAYERLVHEIETVRYIVETFYNN